MDWRRLNRAAHRDLGYFCVGLTLLYAITGLLLNHIHDWNPIYAVGGRSVEVGALKAESAEAVAAETLKKLGMDRPVLSTVWSSETGLDIFLEGGDKVSVDLATGLAWEETVKKRTISSSLNDLHLNRPRGGWTFIADLYAVALSALAVTGALLAFRKGSVSRRGVLLTGVGIAAALLSLLFVI